MSFKATIEFLLHLDSFRNVDLFNQGLYRLRLSIFHENGQEKTKAIPYNIIENFPNNKPKKAPAYQTAEIDEDQTYLSKSFLIRFCEETFDINEICQFRCEIDAYPTLFENNLFFECELLFYDTVNSTYKYNLPEEFPAFSLFKKVSSFRSKVNNVHTGISEYVPMVFDEEHYCLVNASFHTLLFDFQFRVSPIEKKLVQAVNLDNFETKTSEQQQTPAKPIKSFFEFIEKITNWQEEEVDRFYNLYIRTLKNGYENISKHLEMFLQRISAQKGSKKTQLQAFITQCGYVPLPNPAFLKENQGKEKEEEKNNAENSDVSTISSNSIASEVKNKVPMIKITKYLKCEEKKQREQLCNAILAEINSISYFMFQIWYNFLDLLKIDPHTFLNTLRESYNGKMKERWGESIFREKIRTNDLSAFHEPKIGENHKTIAKSLRKKFYYQNLETLNIEDLNMFPKAEIHPIIFDEVYILDKNKQKNDNNMQKEAGKMHKKSAEMDKSLENTLHIFIFAHGFQGNSFDMRLFKNTLSVLYPDYLFLSSIANEDNTEKDINELGKNLATEVKNFVLEWCPKNEPKRISFIGHSLGGVIIRAALPYLEEFRDSMYTFLTLSTPHMGYLYNTSSLIDAGMWILKRWKKSISLRQLSLSDEKNMQESFMYKLSEKKGLNWFRNIVLVSSYQDAYAPFESARIQQCKKAINDPSKGAIYQKMLENLLGNLKADRIHRVDVNFNINKKNLDNFIGRAAHIQFLESQALVKMLVYAFDEFFR